MRLTPVQRELVNKNKNMAFRLAGKYYLISGKRVDLEDVEQMALEGLCKAALKFNPDGGLKFSTYAYKAIINTILRAIPKFITNLSYPENIIFPSSKEVLADARQKFFDNYGRKVDEVFAYKLADPNAYVENNLQPKSDVEVVHKVLNRLTPERREVLCLHYGIEPYPEMPVKDIAEMYGIRVQAVYQRIHVARKHFRRLIGEQIDFYI